MTTAVETALASGGERIEWVLAIEGVGWAESISLGFDGVVFVTNDLDGDLASRLGCTIHKGLGEPGGLSSKADITRVQLKPGTMAFEIQESEDDFLETIFRPLVNEASQSELYEDVDYNQTVFEITSGVQYEVGDTFWIAGRELCLVSARSATAGGRYDMTVQRGYLGTPKGRLDYKAIDKTGFQWAAETKIYAKCKFWHDRRVALYAHVPGTATTEINRVYSGRMRPFDTEDGVVWRIDTVADTVVGSSRVRESPKGCVAVFMQYLDQYGGRAATPALPAAGGGSAGNTNRDGTDPNAVTVAFRHVRLWPRLRTESDFEKYCIAIAYNYRWSPSNGLGTGNIKAAIEADPKDPYSWDGYAAAFHRVDCMLNIGGEYVYAERMRESQDYMNLVVAKSPYGQDVITDFGMEPREALDSESGIPVKFLLDNVKDEWQKSRFSIDREVRRNPCDVLAIFLTSMNSEYFVADCAAGGTTTTVPFTAPGFIVNEWAGYAVFCVEGGDATNHGYARKILSNTATTLTVEAFPYASVSGAEYQIRNSIYDVLPLGWGLGQRNQDIDLDSLEALKRQYLQSAELGKFAIGDTDGFDIWKVLQENICQPYGIIPQIDPATAKLTFAYVGATIPDGVVDDYVSISAHQINSFKGPYYSAEAPIAKIILKVRDRFTAMISPIIERVGVFGDRRTGYEEGTATDVGLNGKSHDIIVTNKDLDFGYHPDDVGTLEIKALFNDEGDSAFLTMEAINRIFRMVIHPAEFALNVSQEFITQIKAGDMVSITDTTKFNPIDPISGGRGWTNQLCRIIEANSQLKGTSGQDIRVMALRSVDAALIAPACLVIGSGLLYFSVEESEYTSQSGVKDQDYFEAGDRIEHRDIHGAQKGTYEIDSIDDVNNRIYITAGGTPAVAAGDYIVFESWCGGCATANESLYAFYGADSDGLLDGADEAPEWA